MRSGKGRGMQHADPIDSIGKLPIGTKERMTQRLKTMLSGDSLDDLLSGGWVIYFNDDGWLDVRRGVKLRKN